MSVLQRLQNKSKASIIDFTDITKIQCTIKFKQPLDLLQYMNARVEEFITFALLGNKMYAVGFIGQSAICKAMDVEVEGIENKPFALSVKREILLTLDKKEELTLHINNSDLEWHFKYYDGYLLKKGKTSNSIYEFKKYLDFILNWEGLHSLGKFDSETVKSIHKKLEKVERNPMDRNVILGDGYVYSVLPSYVFFKTCSTKEATLLTESIITNLPKHNTEFDIRYSANMTGLINDSKQLYVLFPSMSCKNTITPYTKLNLKWYGCIPNVENIVSTLTFKDKSIGVIFEFDSNSNTISINESTKLNKFIGLGNVEQSGVLEIGSIIQDFNKIMKFGAVTDRGKEYIKSILFEDGVVCLTQ